MAAAPAPASAFEHGLRRLLRPDETVSERGRGRGPGAPPLRPPGGGAFPKR